MPGACDIEDPADDLNRVHITRINRFAAHDSNSPLYRVTTHTPRENGGITYKLHGYHRGDDFVHYYNPLLDCSNDCFDNIIHFEDVSGNFIDLTRN